MRSSHDIAGQVMKCLNVELELALVTIQKCLLLLHDDDLSPNKLCVINQSKMMSIKGCIYMYNIYFSY